MIQEPYAIYLDGNIHTLPNKSGVKVGARRNSRHVIRGAMGQVGQDILFPPNTAPGTLIYVYDSASPTANSLGAASATGGTGTTDTGWTITAIAQDSNGNYWYQVSLDPNSFGGNTTGYVPATSAAIPAGMANVSAITPENMITSGGSGGPTTNTTPGTNANPNTSTQKTTATTPGGGGNGFINLLQGPGLGPFNFGESFFLALLGVGIGIVTVNELQK